MILADLHMHSTFSDGKLSVPELVDLYGQAGFGAISITDHLCENTTVIGRAAHYIGATLTPATFPLYREIIKSETERAWDRYRMVLLPGFELTKNSVSNHRSAHILAIGVDEYIHADGDVTELIPEIHAQGGIAVAAHPVSTGKHEKQTHYLWDRREELASLLDAWEVASGSILFDEVLRSKLPMLANSDLHKRRQFSSWKTVIDCERHPEAILDAIRKQKLSFRYYQEPANDLNGYTHASSLGDSVVADPFRNLLSAEAV